MERRSAADLRRIPQVRRGEFRKTQTQGPKASRSCFRTRSNKHDDSRQHLPDVHHQGPRQGAGQRPQNRGQRARTVAHCCASKCVEDTRAEAGCLYYGWTVKEDGSKLFCRETYVDGAAAGHHLSCVAKSGALGEALEKGYIALDNIDLMGTESDIADAKKVPEFEGFGLGSWTVWDSFQNFKQTSAEEASTADFFTIQPTFTIKDLKKAEPFMKKCVDLTKSEAGCMYYGWTIQGDKLFCREAYVDAAAVQAHLDNIVPSVGEMLDSGAASLDKIEFHGPKEGWPTFKKSADALGAIYWDRYASFSKYKM
jgi:quinol monooxygenase YgiN